MCTGVPRESTSLSSPHRRLTDTESVVARRAACGCRPPARRSRLASSPNGCSDRDGGTAGILDSGRAGRQVSAFRLCGRARRYCVHVCGMPCRDGTCRTGRTLHYPFGLAGRRPAAGGDETVLLGRASRQRTAADVLFRIAGGDDERRRRRRVVEGGRDPRAASGDSPRAFRKSLPEEPTHGAVRGGSPRLLVVLILALPRPSRGRESRGGHLTGRRGLPRVATRSRGTPRPGPRRAEGDSPRRSAGARFDRENPDCPGPRGRGRGWRRCRTTRAAFAVGARGPGAGPEQPVRFASGPSREPRPRTASGIRSPGSLGWFHLS